MIRTLRCLLFKPAERCVSSARPRSVFTKTFDNIADGEEGATAAVSFGMLGVL
jgi:hypothetical protein